MLKVNSFLRLPGGDFIRAESCDVLPSDPDYVEGAIEIIANGREIVGKLEWDYVDQLWAYISTMVKTLQESTRVDTYYPDQPINLSFERKGSRVIIESRDDERHRTADVSASEFFQVFRESGEKFFDHLSNLNPGLAATYSIARAKLMIRSF